MSNALGGSVLAIEVIDVNHRDGLDRRRNSPAGMAEMYGGFNL